MASIKPTEEELTKMLDLASELEDEDELFRGMTYQDGVKYTLEWVLGFSIEPPFVYETYRE